MHPVSVEIGIPTLNRTTYAVQTVKEVLKQQLDASFSVHVVDQSDPATLSEEMHQEIEALRSERQVCWEFVSVKGLPVSRNLLLCATEADIMVFVDDDVLLPDGFLQAHVDVYRNEPDVSGVAGPVYHRKPHAQPEDLRIEDPTKGTGEHFTGRNPGVFTKPWLEIMVGCNHSVRVADAVRVEGYDENIVGGYYEDSEFSCRLRKSGVGKIAFEPKAWLLHLRAPSGGCRIVGNVAHTEAEKLSGYLLFAYRHLRGTARWKLMRQALRVGPLRKENVLNPGRSFAAWMGWFRAWRDAIKKRDTVNSPFTT